jgi:group I intron endonuclease
MIVIYCITNKINSKKYVGSAKNFHIRKRLHLNQLRRGDHHSILLQRAWQKYGSENFVFSILEKLDNVNNLLSREQWWIDNSPCEYNICKIAGSSLGLKRSDVTKEKIRKAKLGVKHPEWRNKLKSLTQGGKKRRGFSDESKLKMSKAQKNLYAKGYVHPLKGKKVSAEQLEKMKLAPCIKVLQISKNGDIIKEWNSIKEAGNALNVPPTHISSCCKQKPHYKTCGGFVWKYKNE